MSTVDKTRIGGKDMKKLFSMVMALLMCASVVNPVAATYRAAEDEETNWVQENGTWYVLDEAENKMTGWYRDAKLCWYYLDYQSGAMKTEWAADGKDENGNVKWYYFGDNGIMKTGWQTIAGNRYYFYDSGDEAGLMTIGTVEIDGLRYNFSNTGELIGQSNKGEPIISPYEPVATAVDEILDEIIKPNMTEREELKAIHDWVCLNVSYGGPRTDVYYLEEGSRTDGKDDLENFGDRNGSYTTYNYVYATIKGGEGVCQHYAMVFNALAQALGYKVTITGGTYDGRGHAVSLVWFDNEWLIVDCQLNDYRDDGSIIYSGFLVKHDDYSHYESQAQYWLDWYNYSDPLMQSIENTWENDESWRKEFSSPQEMYDYYTGASN